MRSLEPRQAHVPHRAPPAYNALPAYQASQASARASPCVSGMTTAAFPVYNTSCLALHVIMQKARHLKLKAALQGL